MPPTLRNGRTESAITIIPIPPSHCRIARQSKIPGGASEIWVRIVEPVVVIPETASKTESVRDKLRSERAKGAAAAMARAIQLKVVKRNACRTEMLKTSPVLLRMSAPPRKAVQSIQRRKDFQSGFPAEKSTMIGRIIATERIERKIPMI